MKHFNLTQLFLLCVFVPSLFVIPACNNDTEDINIEERLTKNFDAQVPLDWYALFLEIDRYSPGYRPPAAARMLGYVGMAGYEAAVPGMPDHNSLESEFPGLSIPGIESGVEYHWPTCVNAAYAASFKYFYPHIKSEDAYRIIALENRFNTDFAAELDPQVFNRSKAFGYVVAEAVYDYSKTDTYGHEAYTNPRPSSYVPPAIGPNGEKLWQPTFPDYTPALFPYWGSVRPFAMSQSDLIAKPPLPYSEDPNSKFYQQANETRMTVNNAEYEDEWIAEFWSDDFFQLTFEPAGRQIAIANILVADENLPLDQAVELYAKMGMAMCDAAIAIWNSKYIYNVIRPIQYIRDVIQPDWTTLLNNPMTGVKSLTPEFPAYPSGHSGFGGSASAIMAEMFSNTHPYTDNCHQNRNEFKGTPRSYNTILEAGVENAYSRLPLGVHFRMDCDEGLRLGYLAALRVQEMSWYK